MLNGDQLTDIDLTAQLRQHERTGARATIALIAVEDPSAYGLVRRRDDLSVSGFLEKPNADEIDTNLVNAGVYVLERSVLGEMAPPGTRISIERDVFPRLVDHGLFGYEASGLLDGHRHAAALSAGDLRHPRRRDHDRDRPSRGGVGRRVLGRPDGTSRGQVPAARCTRRR